MIIKNTLQASFIAAALTFGGMVLVAPAFAQQTQDEAAPATFSANEMTHDQEHGTITARAMSKSIMMSVRYWPIPSATIKPPTPSAPQATWPCISHLATSYLPMSWKSLVI